MNQSVINVRLLRSMAFAWLCFLLSAGALLSAEGPAPSEDQVKAAILFNLTKYVDWPAQSFANTNSPLILGILGEDNFGDDFRRMVEQKSINGRKLLVRHLASSEGAQAVHLLFISASEKKRLPEILAKLKGAPVLTVGETETFISLGGIIRLANRENRIRPEVNLAAAERAHLKISSKLLNVSDVIKSRPGERKD